MPTVDLVLSDKGLYQDKHTGQRVSTNSMMKTFRRCPNQAKFKYAERLKPKMLGGPLKRGKWIHELLEYHHSGKDWKALHTKLSAQFNKMFDEEKEFYGDMPSEILSIMNSYVWHYKLDPWTVHDVEITIETEFPDGTLFRGKADALIENHHGLWIVDHKSHKTLPNFDNRLLDTQSALYVWAARRSGIPVNGFIWNYLRWKPAGVPELLKDGSRLSKVAGKDTDYPTYVAALNRFKRGGFKITQEHRDRAAYLKQLRYDPARGFTQPSTMFRRNVLERTDDTLKMVALENYRTSQRMHSYDFQRPGVERTIDRSCDFMCSYKDLCISELAGGNTDLLRHQNYTKGDPNDYYEDQHHDWNDKDSNG